MTEEDLRKQIREINIELEVLREKSKNYKGFSMGLDAKKIQWQIDGLDSERGRLTHILITYNEDDED